MSFDFEKFKSNLYKTAVAAKDTSLTVVGITKCKLKIIELKAELESKYIQIGKIIYNKENTENEIISSLCDEIDDLKASIESLQIIVDEALNRKKCPNCENFCERKFGFCPVCGNKFEI